MNAVANALHYQIFENSLVLWIATPVVWLIALRMLRKLQAGGVKTLRKFAHGKSTRPLNLLADLLMHTQRMVLVLLSLNISLFLLRIPNRYHRLTIALLSVVLLFQVAIWLNALIDFYIDDIKKRKLETDPATVTTISALALVVKTICVITLFLVGWRYIFGQEPPTTLITGLGVGGIAIGLASQSILSDLFACVTILLDKPFVIGDLIVIGDYTGTVEHVGLKSTRLRSLSGEQLVFSNQDLLSSRTRNFKRMFQRRVLFQIGVTYLTSTEKLKSIPDLVRKIVEGQPQTRFDRCHFCAFSDTALRYEIVFYVLSSQYNRYMDTQQAINLSIVEEFRKNEINFAFTSPPAAGPPRKLDPAG